MQTALTSAAKLLCEAAEANRLVLFIGAGASAGLPSKLPTWTGFAERMAVAVEQVEPGRATFMRDRAKAGDFIEVGDLFEKAMRQPDRAAFFRETFDRPRAEMPPVYSLLANIPAVHCVTTNFDPFLRYALTEADPSAEIVGNTMEDLKMVMTQWSKKRIGLYLHGRAAHPDSVVYNNNTFKSLVVRPGFRDLVRRLFLEHTVLMYGYSCSDPDIIETLRYIGECLAGAGEATHYMLATAPPPPVLADLFAKANVRVLLYDPADGHAESKEFLRSVAEVSVIRSVDVLSAYTEEQLRRLSRVFLSLRDLSGRATTYQRACAAIVLNVLSGQDPELPEGEVHRRIMATAHVDAATADRMVAEAVSLLASDGRIVVGSKNALSLAEKEEPSGPPYDAVVDAVEVRTRTYNRTYQSSPVARLTIQQAVTHVMLAQGMTVARSMLQEEDVGGYDLDLLIAEALGRAASLPEAIRRDLRRSIAEVLREPDLKTGADLFELANAAYSLETLFLNPVNPDFGSSILKWKIFLDSNVVLRLVVQYARDHKAFRQLTQRCQRIGTPLAVLYPFVEECVTHVRRVGEQLKNVVQGYKISQVREYVEALDPRERSPVLDWYFVWLQTKGGGSFDRFIAENKILTEAHWEARLKDLGIAVEERDVNKTLDSSERETLWAELRKWRADPSQAGRSLRRNEASQVWWMVNLREKGVRAWFLSIDGQLRRALMTLEAGRYAGFVMTPTALAHQLAELHWGELELGGFTAMMWSFPRQTPHERAAGVIMRQVLSKSDTSKVEPDVLRDHVEKVLAEAKFDAVIPSAMMDGSAENEKVFMDALRDLLPKAVQTILDDVIRRNN
ncbi:MAG: SIR2 family protein [Labilithrix sp.]|nr:SIR2 family protein [Labilithrix sp.]